MIVDVHKYLIVGSKAEMDRFFSLAQVAGFVEFIGPSHKKTIEMPEEAQVLLSAIKIVRQHTASTRTLYLPVLDPVKLGANIVKLNGDYEQLLEEQRLLHADIARIAAFGDFSHADLEKTESEGKRIFQFFCMKSNLAREFLLPPEVIYIGTEYDLAYFVAINKERTQYPKMIEIIIDRSVGELRERLHQVGLAITQTEQEIHDSAKVHRYLQNGLTDYLNAYSLQLAKHNATSPLGASLFAVEAWVPATKTKSLFGLLSGFDVFAEEIAVESRDKIPTYMENKGIHKVGEDLVQIYDTPAYTDKDPSLWVLIFFALFFAIIVSDAGYGLVYLSTGLFLKWKVKKASRIVRRFIKLILIVSTVCILWGILTASFFGIQVGPNNPFRKTSFIHYMATKKAAYHMQMKDVVYEENVKEFPGAARAVDGHDFLLKASSEVDGKWKYDALEDFYDSILLEFSLFVGFVHLSFSFLRYMTRNWTGFGWIIFMIGGYLYFPSYVDATSFINFMGWITKPVAYAIGQHMIFIGLGSVLLIALLQKRRWGALHELTNSIQIFADVLSYLRLYALALAGTIMAATFNDLGMELGMFGLIFITLIGHFVNLNLTIASGAIHGLRLNFLEWYHYSYEGGGCIFNPLCIRKTK